MSKYKEVKEEFNIDEIKSVYKNLIKEIYNHNEDLSQDLLVASAIYCSKRLVGHPTVPDEIQAHFPEEVTIQKIEEVADEFVEFMDLEDYDVDSDKNISDLFDVQPLEYCQFYIQNRNIINTSDFTSIVGTLDKNIKQNEKDIAQTLYENYNNREIASLYIYLALSLSHWDDDNNKANLQDVCNEFGVEYHRVAEAYIEELYKSDWELKSDAYDNNTGVFQHIEQIIEENNLTEEQIESILYKSLYQDWNKVKDYDNKACAIAIVLKATNLDYSDLNVDKPENIVNNISEKIF